MRVIEYSDELHIEQGTAIAIGKFDGVHIGHRRLIDYILRQRANGLSATVFTFNPSPEELFTGVKPRELCTRDEKIEILDRLGIDIMVEYPLTFETAAIEPEAFVRDVLVKRLNMKYFAAGNDLSFGAGGRGNVQIIDELSNIYNYSYDIINKVCVDDIPVSSTRIRDAFEQGHVEEAFLLLEGKRRVL